MSAGFIDTHAHYNLPAYADDLDDVMAAVRDAGVERVICPAIGYGSNAQMLETDAPYVLPAGFGSERNDSTAIPMIAREVAALRGEDIEDVARYTTGNAIRLFFPDGRTFGEADCNLA